MNDESNVPWVPAIAVGLYCRFPANVGCVLVVAPHGSPRVRSAVDPGRLKSKRDRRRNAITRKRTSAFLAQALACLLTMQAVWQVMSLLTDEDEISPLLCHHTLFSTEKKCSSTLRRSKRLASHHCLQQGWHCLTWLHTF